MQTKLITMTLIFFSFSAFTQMIPPDPDPGCDQIQRVGLILANGQNTQHFIGGYNIENDLCEGVNAGIGYDQLNPGEYAYGSFDADLIYETTPEMVDFTFDLTNTLNSLPIGQQVKVAVLNSSNQYAPIADLTLRKIANIAAVSSGSGKKPTIDPYLWQVIIKWYGSFTTLYTEESFVFTMNELVEYNYIFDDSDPNSPVSMISLGGNDISVNPYSLPTGGLTTYSLGMIDTSTTLYVGDKIIFDINWPSDGNATE